MRTPLKKNLCAVERASTYFHLSVYAFIYNLSPLLLYFTVLTDRHIYTSAHTQRRVSRKCAVAAWRLIVVSLTHKQSAGSSDDSLLTQY